MSSLSRTSLLAATLVLAPGCASTVANLVGSSLGSDSSTFAADDDPELVREAIPFGLKTIESLLESSPGNEKLLLAAASGFTQYSFAFVKQDADELDATSPIEAKAKYARARRLFARALGYGMRGLAARHSDFAELWKTDRAKAMSTMETTDVPFLYWTGAALGAQISISKDDMKAVGRVPEMEALMARALELDEAWGQGSIHEFYVTYDNRSASLGGSRDRALKHLQRVQELTGGRKVGPLVSWAEAVAVPAQDKKLFDEMLDKALAFDADEEPRFRLVNLIAQRRARMLKARAKDLFVED